MSKYFGLKGMKNFSEKQLRSNVSEAKNSLKKLGIEDQLVVEELDKLRTSVSDKESYLAKKKDIDYIMQLALQNKRETVLREINNQREELKERPNDNLWKKELRRLEDLRAEINKYQDQISSKPELKQEVEQRKQQVQEELAQSVQTTGANAIGAGATGARAGFVESLNSALAEIEAEESVEQSYRNEHIDNPIDPKHELNPIQVPTYPLPFKTPPKRRKVQKALNKALAGMEEEEKVPESPMIEADLSLTDDDDSDGGSSSSVYGTPLGLAAPAPTPAPTPEPDSNNDSQTTGNVQPTDPASSSSFGGPDDLKKVPKYHLFPIRLFFGSETEPKWDQTLASQIYDWHDQTKMPKKQIKDLCDDIIGKNGAEILVSDRKSDGDIQELVELIELQFAITKPRLHNSGQLGIIKLGQLEQNLKASMGMSGSTSSSLPSDAIVDNPFKAAGPSGVGLTDDRNLTKEQRLVQKRLLEQKLVEEYRNRDRGDDNKPITNEIIKQFVIQEKEQQSKMKPVMATDFYELTKGYAISYPANEPINFPGAKKEVSFDSIMI